MQNNWYFTLIFIFSILAIIKVIVDILINLFSQDPTKISFNKYELLFYGVCVSYFLTYILI
jgi:hypothetical protein